MLIRSQDKTELINMNNIEKIIIINESRIVVQTVSNQQWTTIGEYPKDKTMKVMDKIQNAYSDCMRFFSQDGLLEHVTDIPNKVFEMPQEDEI